MKRIILTTIILFSVAAISLAQSWQKFNYQAVARDAMGEVIENQAIGVRISIHSGTMAGPTEYQETHTVTTNDFGLFDLAIGGGTVVSGDFTIIPWGGDDFFVQVEMDPAGGTAYADMGTSQLLSTPYAMHAANAGALSVAGTSSQTLRHDGTNWIASSSLLNDGIKVGAGEVTSGELDGVFTVRGQNSATDGIEGVFLDIINDETNTAGTLAGIRFANYPVTSVNDHIPGGIFWKSDGQVFGRGDLVFVTGTAGGSANVGTNARMTISNDGFVGIGESAPICDLHINQSGGNLTNEETGGLDLQNGNTSWRIYNSATANSYLRFNYSPTGSVYTEKAYVLNNDGSWNQVSDASMKRNVEKFGDVLSLVLQLEPLKYHYIDNKEDAQKSMGFLAQDAQKLFPETVSHEDGGTLLGIDYSKFAVIAIKAIQEQQTLIEQLQTEIELLKNK